MLDSIPSLNAHLFTHSQTYSKLVFHCPNYYSFLLTLYLQFVCACIK